jgi:3-dehydroquinate dehydratase/shikimate dehydrogenase
MRLKPAYVDIEASVPFEKIEHIRALAPDTRVILSQHDFKKTPASLEAMLDPMRKKADGVIYKIATYAKNGLDALRMLVFCREQGAKGVPLICICMWAVGVTTRILAPVVHTGFCYCPVEESSAPGQIDAVTLRNIYNFSELDSKTAIYGLLGDPVEQSVGHLYHNERNKAAACNAVYVKWRIAKEEVIQAMPLLYNLGVRGLSVTMPLKETVCSFIAGADAAGLDMASLDIGAVNTLKITAGGFSATNTDGQGVFGALAALGAADVNGKKLILLGAGGAARAVVYEATKRGASLVIYNRTPDKKLPLYSPGNSSGDSPGNSPENSPGNPPGISVLPLSRISELESLEYDIIINALPFGVPFAFETVPFKKGTVAMDLSYGKASAFLQRAGQAGCIIADGAGMFACQAHLQRVFWGLPGRE